MSGIFLETISWSPKPPELTPEIMHPSKRWCKIETGRAKDILPFNDAQTETRRRILGGMPRLLSRE